MGLAPLKGGMAWMTMLTFFVAKTDSFDLVAAVGAAVEVDAAAFAFTAFGTADEEFVWLKLPATVLEGAIGALGLLVGLLPAKTPLEAMLGVDAPMARA